MKEKRPDDILWVGKIGVQPMWRIYRWQYEEWIKNRPIVKMDNEQKLQFMGKILESLGKEKED